MPRRRMLDPSFTDDVEVAQLTRDERLFLVGCLRNADDDGRLRGHPAYLKSEIFMYDEDIDLKCMGGIKESTLEKMQHWRRDNIWLLVAYQNTELDYLYFPNWSQFNKPSHPSPSKLPAPPDSQELLLNPSGEKPEPVQSSASIPQGTTPESIQSASSLSQVSQVKDSIGKVREVKEDFQKFLDSENDLTDLLMTTLTKHVSAGRAQALAAEGGLGELPAETEATVRMNWGIQVLKKCWKDGVGEDMPNRIFEGARGALKNYSLGVVAKAFAKGVRYKGGKHKSWKYIQTIIDEEMEKHG